MSASIGCAQQRTPKVCNRVWAHQRDLVAFRRHQWTRLPCIRPNWRRAARRWTARTCGTSAGSAAATCGPGRRSTPSTATRWPLLLTQTCRSRQRGAPLSRPDVARAGDMRTWIRSYRSKQAPALASVLRRPGRTGSAHELICRQLLQISHHAGQQKGLGPGASGIGHGQALGRVPGLGHRGVAQETQAAAVAAGSCSPALCRV